MWYGASPSNCWIYSPRSVSTLSILFFSRNLLRWISSVTMLLLFTMVVQFLAWHILSISFSASSGVSAQMTLAPFLVMLASKVSSCLSSVSIAFHLIFFALSLASSTLVNCCLPTGTTALYLEILKLILRRCSLSEALTVLLAIKDDD